MKLLSLFQPVNLTIGNKILWKKRSNFSSFPQYFQYISNFRSQITYSFVNCDIIFLNSANLICRGMNISKCFRESLRLRDNEGRLYIFFSWWNIFVDAVNYLLQIAETALGIALDNWTIQVNIFFFISPRKHIFSNILIKKCCGIY